jgi:hypothetical protein
MAVSPNPVRQFFLFAEEEGGRCGEDGSSEKMIFISKF